MVRVVLRLFSVWSLWILFSFLTVFYFLSRCSCLYQQFLVLCIKIEFWVGCFWYTDSVMHQNKLVYEMQARRVVWASAFSSKWLWAWKSTETRLNSVMHNYFSLWFQETTLSCFTSTLVCDAHHWPYVFIKCSQHSHSHVHVQHDSHWIRLFAVFVHGFSI